jgi:ribosomal protein S18 acetylase RimI-like enzyme
VRQLCDVAELGQLEPLWLGLHRHHRAVGPAELLLYDDAASWERRRALSESWMRTGAAIVLVADVSGMPAAGYLVTHVRHGPDDTFAVADPYAELYSLSVEREHRGHGVGAALLDALEGHLGALGIGDVNVAVMVGNDDVLRLYERRGFRLAEISLWRTGTSRV